MSVKPKTYDEWLNTACFETVLMHWKGRDTLWDIQWVLTKTYEKYLSDLEKN